MFGGQHPITSFELRASQAITKPCEFAEDNHVVILASDDGRVRVCDVETGRVLQILLHSDGTQLIMPVVSSAHFW